MDLCCKTGSTEKHSHFINYRLHQVNKRGIGELPLIALDYLRRFYLFGSTVFVYAALKIRPPFHPVSFRADLIVLYTADCLALDLSGVIIIYFSSSNAFLCLSQCMNTWILVLLTEPRLRRKHASGSTKIVPLFNMHWLKYGRCLIIIFRPAICKEYLTKD